MSALLHELLFHQCHIFCYSRLATSPTFLCLTLVPHSGEYFLGFCTFNFSFYFPNNHFWPPFPWQNELSDNRTSFCAECSLLCKPIPENPAFVISSKYSFSFPLFFAVPTCVSPMNGEAFTFNVSFFFFFLLPHSDLAVKGSPVARFLVCFPKTGLLGPYLGMWGAERFRDV